MNALSDPHHLKADAAMVRRAIREDWPLTPEIRRMIVSQMALVAGRSGDERNRIAAAKVLVAADSVNVRREALDQADEHHAEGETVNHQVTGGIVIADLRREVLADADYLEFLRRQDESTIISQSGGSDNGSDNLEPGGDHQTNGHAGAVCANGEPGPVENGKALNDPRPGTNGYHHG